MLKIKYAVSEHLINTVICKETFLWLFSQHHVLNFVLFLSSALISTQGPSCTKLPILAETIQMELRWTSIRSPDTIA